MQTSQDALLDTVAQLTLEVSKLQIFSCEMLVHRHNRVETLLSSVRESGMYIALSMKAMSSEDSVIELGVSMQLLCHCGCPLHDAGMGLNANVDIIFADKVQTTLRARAVMGFVMGFIIQLG